MGRGESHACGRRALSAVCFELNATYLVGILGVMVAMGLGQDRGSVLFFVFLFVFLI